MDFNAARQDIRYPDVGLRQHDPNPLDPNPSSSRESPSQHTLAKEYDVPSRSRNPIRYPISQGESSQVDSRTESLTANKPAGSIFSHSSRKFSFDSQSYPSKKNSPTGLTRSLIIKKSLTGFRAGQTKTVNTKQKGKEGNSGFQQRNIASDQRQSYNLGIGHNETGSTPHLMQVLAVPQLSVEVSQS